MLGIVIPAHNEQDTIAECVGAARRAALHPHLAGEAAEIVVVTDGCTDATGVLAARAGAITLSVRARNVGVARAVGAEVLLARGARWLAFTDADTLVSPTWLADQLSLDVDAVCGTVGVEDWSPHGIHADLLRLHFVQTYQDRDGHQHVHGANLGVSALAYRRAGGFRHLGCSEDVDLVRALEASGATIAWSAKPRVMTSARSHARARGGFADALLNAVAETLNSAALPALTSP
ncbi:glycosyltransferase family A protein [Variovorax sp. J2P1-59]|uniref:glycosyltransferase n=1 Tax=Variovorax flavidus TaxID=3053501 RepID=UPI0025762523|nr:glycosyltransferase family A protein [Variovorax sp. J2P1-59]MDM0073803.1 glycosyltransferase family A protein [Variovorax sp. J2P1-59]